MCNLPILFVYPLLFHTCNSYFIFPGIFLNSPVFVIFSRVLKKLAIPFLSGNITGSASSRIRNMAHVGVRDATGRFTETFEIFAKLPGPGSLTSINVRHTTTVAELKSLIELVCGIPSDLQLLSYRHHSVLTDGGIPWAGCVSYRGRAYP